MIKIATFALILAGTGVAAPRIHCASAPAQLEKMQKEADELYKLRDEMNAEFEGVIQKDMQLLAEGSREGSHRAVAVKLAFARNRLNKKIEGKEKEQADFTKEFCKGCAPDKKALDKLAKFCEVCEDASRCPEDQ